MTPAWAAIGIACGVVGGAIGAGLVFGVRAWILRRAVRRWMQAPPAGLVQQSGIGLGIPRRPTPGPFDAGR